MTYDEIWAKYVAILSSVTIACLDDSPYLPIISCDDENMKQVGKCMVSTTKDGPVKHTHTHKTQKQVESSSTRVLV